jgi:sugar O-acyltransferase (sialic acid O-acetyltransferase NeuD family)
MKNNIIIVGAFHEMIELAEDLGYEVTGLIDNIIKENYRGCPVICNDDKAKSLRKELKKIPLVISPDLPAIRNKLYIYYKGLGFSFISLISKNATISKSSELNLGIVVQSGVNISASSKIGKFVKLNTCCNIMHDVIVGDFTTVAPNAVVLGNVKIGNCTYIGANSTILPNLSIGDSAIIGAGSIVTKNIPNNEIWFGNPAKKSYLSN